MHPSRRSIARGALSSAFLVFSLLFLPTFSQAQSAATDAESDETAAEAGDSEEARRILAGMASFLAAQKSFSVEIGCAHDTVQASGQKLEFLEKRTLTVRRPNELRMDVERSDGKKTAVFMNASSIVAADLSEKVYAQADSKGSLDDSLKYFIRDLRMRMPLAMLISSQLAGELEKRTVQAELVETTSILGMPTHHISGSTDTVDFQVWVGAGKQPLPYRIVLTYKEAEGEPQFRANFTEWKLSPWVSDSTFEYAAGKDAKRIAFLNQIKAAPAAQSAAASQGVAK